MNLNPKSENIVKAHIAIISSKDIELSIKVIRSMSASRRRFCSIRLLFIPNHILQIKRVKVVDPSRPIKTSKEIHRLIDKTPSHAHSRGRGSSLNCGLVPSHVGCVEVEQII